MGDFFPAKAPETRKHGKARGASADQRDREQEIHIKDTGRGNQGTDQAAQIDRGNRGNSTARPGYMQWLG